LAKGNAKLAIGRRLEGVLKIIQASQTDALVRVLDERPVQLLDENLGAAIATLRPSVQLVDASRKPDARRLTHATTQARARNDYRQAC
jgi:hypothetical protein